MKKVLLALIVFIIVGTYINRLDRSYILYPAEPLVVVPEGQTTSSVLGAVQAAREASSSTAARTLSSPCRCTDVSIYFRHSSHDIWTIHASQCESSRLHIAVHVASV